MALPSSGSISLNQMHVEVGGSSGSQVSINDSDIRGLISKGSGSQMSFNEWYGASAFTVDTQVTIAPASTGIKNDQPRFQTWNFIIAPSGSFTDNQITLTQGNTYYIHGIQGNALNSNGLFYFSTSSSATGGGGTASVFDNLYWRNANGNYQITNGTAYTEADGGGNNIFTGFRATVNGTNNPGVSTTSQNYNIY